MAGTPALPHASNSVVAILLVGVDEVRRRGDEADDQARVLERLGRFGKFDDARCRD